LENEMKYIVYEQRKPTELHKNGKDFNMNLVEIGEVHVGVGECPIFAAKSKYKIARPVVENTNGYSPRELGVL
jgi:hypothetical protein